MILCRSVHKYITFCSEPLIRTLIRRIKCRISASQTFITYTMRIKSDNITTKKLNFLFFQKRMSSDMSAYFIRISTVSYSSHSHQRSQHNYCHCGSCRFQDSVSPVPVILKTFKFFLCRPGASCLFSPGCFIEIPCFSQSGDQPIISRPDLLLGFFRNSSHEVLPATFSNADPSILFQHHTAL